MLLRPFMQSDDHPAVRVRPMTRQDRGIVADLVVSVENFNPAEVDCALELVDVYLNDPEQRDYHVVVAEDTASLVHAYACWGPVPLTKGTFDLYWIATHPAARGRGFGHALMEYVECKVMEHGGRLLAVETSSKASYERTVAFYRRLGYEEVSRIRDFYDVGDDRLIFTKKLS
jgi:ribosomal protein S18 acetylase RimI-like enzyme